MLSQMTKNVLMVGGGALGGGATVGGFWAFFSRRGKKLRAAEQALAEAELQKRVEDYVGKVAEGETKMKDVASIMGRKYEPAKVSDEPVKKDTKEKKAA